MIWHLAKLWIFDCNPNLQQRMCLHSEMEEFMTETRDESVKADKF